MTQKLESRRKIEGNVEKRKCRIDDRARHMGLVVAEKKQVADASRQLRLSTTSEGAQAVKKAMKEAAKAADKEFDSQNHDIEKKFGECKKAEQDLRDRTKSAKHDAAKAKGAADCVKETKEARKLMHAAEKAATDDASYTDSQKNRQKKDRTESTKRRDTQKSQLANARLAW